MRRSAGDGAKGPRVYDWARVEIRPLKEPGKGYWLLVRRSVAKPEERPTNCCYGPAGVAGGRNPVTECFEEMGLDLRSAPDIWRCKSGGTAPGMSQGSFPFGKG